MKIQTAAVGDARDRSRAWIETLASETGFPLDVVERLYDAEQRRLVERARIVEFVPVLAANNVRKQLRVHAVPSAAQAHRTPSGRSTPRRRSRQRMATEDALLDRRIGSTLSERSNTSSRPGKSGGRV